MYSSADGTTHSHHDKVDDFLNTFSTPVMKDGGETCDETQARDPQRRRYDQMLKQLNRGVLHKYMIQDIRVP